MDRKISRLLLVNSVKLESNLFGPFEGMYRDLVLKMGYDLLTYAHLVDAPFGSLDSLRLARDSQAIICLLPISPVDRLNSYHLYRHLRHESSFPGIVIIDLNACPENRFIVKKCDRYFNMAEDTPKASDRLKSLLEEYILIQSSFFDTSGVSN